MAHIVVKKKKSHRMGLRFLMLLNCLAFFLLLWRSGDFPSGLMMFGLSQLPMIGMLLYFETWSIIFCKNGIQKMCCGRLQSYAWTDVIEISSCRSATEGPYILIRFRHGKQLRFRIEDENGVQAVGVIMKHTSIVSK